MIFGAFFSTYRLRQRGLALFHRDRLAVAGIAAGDGDIHLDLGARLAAEQVAVDQVDGDIDQRPAVQVHVVVALGLGEFDGRVQLLRPFGQFCEQIAQLRVVRSRAASTARYFSAVPLQTPRTAATICNWLVPS